MAEGIEIRAGRNGRKSYRVHVWSNRDRKRIRKTFASLAEAKAWRTDALVALRTGTLQAPAPTTLREAAAVFLAGAEDGTVRDRSGQAYKPSTVRTYREKLDGYVLLALGDFKLSELRRIDVQDFADQLLGSGLSPSSVRNTLDPLRAIYRRAIRRELVAINPTTDIDLPQAKGKRERIATAQEARALLDALPSEDRALWATAFYAGLRRGELRGLRWTDVDLGASEIRVRRGWDAVEGAIEPKSDKGKRTVPLLAILRDYLDQHKLSTGRDGDDLVFGRTATQPFIASTVDNRAKRAWKVAEANSITLHECRHTFASLLIAARENPKAVQAFMGHASITMTFDQYGHLFPGSRDEARARMDAYLEAELAPRDNLGTMNPPLDAPTRPEATA